MGHKCLYEDRLVFDDERQQFYRLITAHWKDKELDVAKVYEDGTAYGRNLEFSYIGGYRVNFPGEKIRCRYTSGSYIVEEEGFEQIFWKFNLWVGRSFINKDYILSKDPSLKYLIAKYNGTKNEELLKVIAVYRFHPEIEGLVQCGQNALAINKSIFRLTEKKRKELIRYVSMFGDKNKNMNLRDIQLSMKTSIPYPFIAMYKQVMRVFRDAEICKYLYKHGYQTCDYYVDYMKMAEEVGHNVKDPYWRFPKDLVAAHNKVMEEKEQKELSLQKVTVEKLKIVSDKLGANVKEVEDYLFYIPNDLKDVTIHANALHQCIVYAGYVEKIINQKSILIFIKKAGQPYGTVEIDYDKKIRQAYCDEVDRSNCKIPEDVMDIVKEYISSLKVKKFKQTQKVEKYFIKGLYRGNVPFNKKCHFEEGMIYDTQVEDKDIESKASNCLATNNVYHFCESLSDVLFYVPNPASFAIVQALGPVVRRDKQLGSNKILIKKIMNPEECIRYVAEMELGIR